MYELTHHDTVQLLPVTSKTEQLNLQHISDIISGVERIFGLTEGRYPLYP
jgi:hypothetical protein